MDGAPVSARETKPQGGSQQPGFDFPRKRRLTRASDIEAVKRAGKRVRTGLLDVRASASPLSYPRIGVVVPKYKHTGVERNRLRRRLRELMRVRLLPVIAPVDLLVRPLPQAYGAPFAALATEVDRLCERLR